MENPQTPNSQSINRRELLKALGAAGGALAAAAFLPGKWAKPLVEAGVVPAHAQSSQVTIANLQVTFNDNLKHNIVIPIWAATFAYVDPLGEVDPGANLYAHVQPCGTIILNGQTVAGAGGSFGPGSNGSAGTLRFPFNGECNTPYDTLYVTLEVHGRSSNEVSAPYQIPG